MPHHARMGGGTIPGRMKTCVCIAAFVVVAFSWATEQLDCVSGGSLVGLEVLWSGTVHAQEAVEPPPMRPAGSEDWRKKPRGSENTWGNAAGGLLNIGIFVAVIVLFVLGVDRLQRRRWLSRVQHSMPCPNANQDTVLVAEIVAEPDSKEQNRSRVVWYYAQDGERVTGPVSASEIRALIGSGKLRRGHFLSNDGHRWFRAETLRGVNWP